MADIPTLDEIGGAFLAYMEGEGSDRNTITVREDGTLEILGAISGEEAIQMLERAAYRIREYMERRPLPSLILTSDYARPEQEQDYGSQNVDDIPF